MTSATLDPARPRAGSPEPPPEKPIRESRAAWLMVSPAMLLLVLFVVVPFLMAFWLSLHNVKLDSARPAVWMGFEQYRRILIDEELRGTFYRSLLNNAVFALVVVPVQTALALGLALLLNRPLRGMAVFRTFFFMPVVFPMALVSVVWTLIYSRDSLGMLNAVIGGLSFGHLGPYDWLGDAKFALMAIAVMSIWQGVGFQMVIILAGLQSIPTNLYEAAAIDKANKWQQFLNVTIPSLRNTLIFVVMITTIFSLRLFDQVYIMTQGGPNEATSTVMYGAVTSAFVENNVGRGSAMTVVFVVIVVLVTLIQRRLLRQEREIA